jgi:hypothetical protein
VLLEEQFVIPMYALGIPKRVTRMVNTLRYGTGMNLLTLASALAIPVAALSLPVWITENFGSILAPTVLAQTASADSHFPLNNESSSPIVEFYVEAANERLGGENENILEQPLQPQESRSIMIAAGTTCLSNIKVVFANGTSRKHKNVDVCKLGGITHGD